MLAEALARWQHAAGPFWPYVCAAPFLGTGESRLLAERVTPGGPMRWTGAHQALADRLLLEVDKALTPDPAGAALTPALSQREPLLPLGEGWREGADRGRPSEDVDDDRSLQVVLADLPAEPLLRIAPLLATRGFYVVPVVQRWIASPAVLPCRQLVTWLLRSAWWMRRPTAPRGVLLIVDGERFGPAGYPLLAAGGAFDNRYEYQICRFPSVRFLAAQGVRRVTWLTAPGLDAPVPGPLGEPDLRALGIPPVARDLHAYRETLLLAGVDVAVAAWLPA